MKPIAIFYHCLFQIGDNPLAAAVPIITSQFREMEDCGLLAEASAIGIGVNGDANSPHTREAIFPKKAAVLYHGLDSRNENSTLMMLRDCLPGNDDWYVLYLHSKGATHPPGHELSTRWRQCGMKHLVRDWRQCVADLDDGYESVGVHWMTGDQTPPGQSIWAGNFWWAKASFLLTLPSMLERDRIKESGLKALESRYESEVWIGNGPRLPKVKDYHPNWDPSKSATCSV